MNANVTDLPRTRLDYASIEEAFPKADPGITPLGNRVLVQIRSPKRRSAGGLFLPEESRDTEMWNTQAALVISCGEVAFKNRDTLEPWPEGDWVTPGQFVRVPKYGGDRFQVPVPGSKDNEQALFVLFKDLDMIGRIPVDRVLDVVAFI